MRILEVRGPARLSGRVEPPPDKSIAHRALILAALAEGDSLLSPALQGRDLHSTASVLRRLGANIETERGGWRVRPGALRAAEGTLDCGNSGTTARLMSGVLAGIPGRHSLDGDASLRRRPMERLRPLAAMGVRLHGPTPLRLPFVIEGAPRLVGRETRLEVASAQVKSALLLAGLRAEGPTRVWEPGLSRDHTERMLGAVGVRVQSEADGGGWLHQLWPAEARWSGRRFQIPPDPSSAAFWLVAGLLTEGELWVRTTTNPTRAGLLDGLRAGGAEIEWGPTADIQGEAVAWARTRRGRLSFLDWGGLEVLRSLDELPILLGALALGAGGRIRDAKELRHKESDRLSAMARVLTAMGHRVEEHPDGLELRPGSHQAAEVDAEGDHRIAMTAAVLGLAAKGWTRIRGAEVVDISYPGFVDELAARGAEIRWGPPQT